MTHCLGAKKLTATTGGIECSYACTCAVSSLAYNKPIPAAYVGGVASAQAIEFGRHRYGWDELE